MTPATLARLAAGFIRWTCCTISAVGIGATVCWSLAGLLDACGFGYSPLAGGVVIVASGVASLAAMGVMLSLTDCEEC